MKCHLIIEGSISEIQYAMGLLSDVKELVKHVGAVPKEFEQLETPEIPEVPHLPIPMERIVFPAKKTHNKDVGNVSEEVDARLQYSHCHKCGIQYIPGKSKSGFCSKKCYMSEYFEKRKTPKTILSTIPEVKKPEVSEKGSSKTTSRKFKKESKPIVTDNFGGMF